MSNIDSGKENIASKVLSIEEKLSILSEAEQDILKVIEISIETSQHIQGSIPFTSETKLLDLSNDLVSTLQSIRNKITSQTDILNLQSEDLNSESSSSSITKQSLLTNNPKLNHIDKQQELQDSFLLSQLDLLASQDL